MPISCSRELYRHNQEEFHAVDYKVIGHAYSMHNKLGRLPNEEIFKEELAHRCRTDSMDVWREMMIRVTHGNFRKAYYVDLVVNGGVFYEAKTVDRLAGDHERQLINYLLLAEQNHGGLINFRNASVEKRFVSTSLTLADRKRYDIDRTSWIESDEKSSQVRTIVEGLLEDWGAYLELSLYREAALFLLGGEDRLVGRVELSENDRHIGHQRMSLLSPTTAIHFSAASKDPDSYEHHLVRLHRHSRLEFTQWINFMGNQIVFKTIH